MRILSTTLLYLALLSASFSTLYAQSGFLIEGMITDQSSGQPLSGATVFVVDTETGVVSDRQGRYSLRVTSLPAQLEIRFLGYKTRLITVTQVSKDINVSLQSESLVLDRVVVSAFEGQRSILETAGSIALITRPVIERSHNVSLAPALNTIAGVRMEESGYGGSSRISIRGSLLRSPFGIRNVKMYWNDIPLTDPSGSTSRFNSLDPSDLGRIEVIKGPAGSLYGAGTGGVLILQSRRPNASERSIEAESTVGAFGLTRSIFRAEWSESGTRARLSLLDQDSRGYRDHQRVWKRSLQFSTGISPSANRDLGFHVFHYDGTYQLPGPLTQAQVNDSPRMAIPFSKSIDARVSLRNTGFALSQQLNLSRQWQNSTSLGLIIQDKENPSGTSPAFNQHEISTFQGITARSVFRYSGMDPQPWSVQFGIEAQTGFSLEKYYSANAGKPGVLRSDAEINARSAIAFAQVEKEIGDKLIATAGLSANVTQYDVIDRLGAQGLGGQDELHFGPTLAPRIALVYKITEELAAHGSLSYGFSTPTQWEVKTLAGVNADLRPEQGLNSELGLRWQSKDLRWAADVSGYRFALKQALLPQFTEAGLPFFANAGSTRQDGLEMALKGEIWRNDAGYRLGLTASGAWNQYRFDDYTTNVTISGQVQARDYSGNAMTGVAPWSGSGSADLEMPWGLGLQLGARYMDAIPLDDANTVYSRSYLIVSGRLDGNWNLGPRWNLGLRLGLENITNRYWDNLLALNGSFGRYYNPGPPRNGYARLSVKRSL